jgi:hypothetical protein
MENTTKYTVNGQEVEVIQQLNDGTYLIEPMLEYEVEDFGGEVYWRSYSGRPYVVDAVFDKPPLEKYHKDIDELATTNLNLREELSKIRADITIAKQELAATTKELSTCDQYSQLISFINNEITHVVDISGYGDSFVNILTFKEAFEDNDGYNNRRGLKLLTLYGDTNGDLQWKINQYRDGSGSSNRTIIPFTSYDSAKEFAFKRIDEKLQTLLETNKPLRYYKDDLIKLADNHGYIATQQVLDCINAEELKQRQEQIAKLESQLVVLKQ